MLTPRTLDPAAALVALLVVGALLAVHIPLARRALADLANRDDRALRVYSRQVWLVLITIAGIIGPVMYFRFGRVEGW